MRYSVDLGGSTIDCSVYDETTGSIIENRSLESALFPHKNIADICKGFDISHAVLDNESLRVTGGKSLLLPYFFCLEGKNIALEKCGEFHAIAKGARFLSGRERGLAVSLGTGTAMVFFDGDNFDHVKGTGVGGGSFLGLGRALLGVSSFDEIEHLAQKGQRESIDLSVKDIVGGDLGMLSGESTASHFAKYSQNSRREDIALGLCLLVSESVTALAIEKAMRLDISTIVVGGKFSRLSMVQQHMHNTGKMFDVEVLFPEDADFMTSIGAVI